MRDRGLNRAGTRLAPIVAPAVNRPLAGSTDNSWPHLAQANLESTFMGPKSFTARLVWTGVAMVTCLTALHAVYYLLPGDPVRALFGFQSPGPELLAELTVAFGLDDPYPVQLGRYLTGLATGDLGPVYRLAPGGLAPAGTTVSEVIWASVPSTMRMVGLAVVVHTILGAALGSVLSEASGRRALAFKATVALLIAVPSFVLAGLAQIGAPGLVDAFGLLAGAAFLAAMPSGLVALIGYPMVRDTRRSAYVLRAMASGVPDRRVRWIHTMRPSMGPMVVLGAAQTDNLLAAAVVVEPVIGRPGLGSVLIEAMNARQGPTIIGVVGTTFVLVAVLNLLADVVTTRLDPRVDAL